MQGSAAYLEERSSSLEQGTRDVGGTGRVTWSNTEAGHGQLIHGRDFQGKMLLVPERGQDLARKDTHVSLIQVSV